MAVGRVAKVLISPTMDYPSPDRKGSCGNWPQARRGCSCCAASKTTTRHNAISTGKRSRQSQTSTDLGCEFLQTSRHSESEQPAVDIPTAYRTVMITALLCQNTDRFASRRRVPRRRRFRKVADPTSESAGRPEEAPTDSSPRGRCLGTFVPSNIWPPLPFGPNRDHGGRDPPPRRSGAGHTQTGDSRRQGKTRQAG